MLKKVAFTMYVVENMERARKFYEGVLGLKVGTNYDERWVEYDLPQGGCFAITSMANGVSPSTTAGGSIAFEVENLQQYVASLKEKGVKFKMDIFESPVCFMAVPLDTEGNAFMLHQVKKK